MVFIVLVGILVLVFILLFPVLPASFSPSVIFVPVAFAAFRYASFHAAVPAFAAIRPVVSAKAVLI